LLLLAALPAWTQDPSPQAPEAAEAAPIKTDFHTLAGWHVPDALFKAKQGHVLRFVPGGIRRLDGKRVAVTGFMLPTRIKNRQVTEFFLMRNQNTCCFGIPPELNEVVEVQKTAHPTKVLMDTPITVVGKLHVRERWEGVFLCSIYQLEAETVDGQ
jgi:hypothetical protein